MRAATPWPLVDRRASAGVGVKAVPGTLTGKLKHPARAANSGQGDLLNLLGTLHGEGALLQAALLSPWCCIAVACLQLAC